MQNSIPEWHKQHKIDEREVRRIQQMIETEQVDRKVLTSKKKMDLEQGLDQRIVSKIGHQGREGPPHQDQP